MISIRCRTNLDLLPCEKWPDELEALPRVGDIIESAHAWDKVHLQLTVASVRWEHRKGKQDLGNRYGPAQIVEIDIWMPIIELHLPPRHFDNLHHFYDWYGKLTGKGKSYFI